MQIHRTLPPAFWGSGEKAFRFSMRITWRLSETRTRRARRNGWSNWLVQTLGVWNAPKLVTSATDGGLQLSNGFEYILEEFNVSEWLLLLKHNWEMTYAKWLQKGNRKTENIRTRLATQKVKCLNGEYCKLKKTCIPSESLMNCRVSLQFLQLQDPEDTDWLFLEHLGVKVERDAHFLIRCLESLRESTSQLHVEQISPLYKAIGDFFPRKLKIKSVLSLSLSLNLSGTYVSEVGATILPPSDSSTASDDTSS
jgi:hypothetical protein